MKNLKFSNWTNDRGFRIPSAALKLAGIGAREQLDFFVAKDVMVTLKHQMTALEMINAIYALNKLANKLLTELTDCCGSCNECVGEDEQNDLCPYGQIFEDQYRLDPLLKEAAGIPKDAKIMAEVDKEAHQVIFSEADYAASLSDVPQSILDALGDNDMRLCVLEQHLKKGDIIHG